MFTSKKRAVIMIIISCFLNMFLSLIAYMLHLPMWLDTVGTIYISIIMGVPYGFCVGLINNVVFTTFLYGYNSMLYYIISFFVALISGLYSKKNNLIKTFNKRYGTISKWILLSFYIFIASSFLASLFAIFINIGTLNNYYEKKLYEYVFNLYSCSICSTIIAVVSIKFIDVVITIIIVMALIKVTPKKYLTDNFCMDLYRKKDYEQS